MTTVRRQQIAAPPVVAGEDGPVRSVNGLVGDVVLGAGDVGVDPQQVASMAATMAEGKVSPAVEAAAGQATSATGKATAAQGTADQAVADAASAAAAAGNARAMALSHRNNHANPHEVTPEQLGLATVATSGSYADLVDKPTIPTVPSVPSKPGDIGAQPAGDYATTSALQQLASTVAGKAAAEHTHPAPEIPAAPVSSVNAKTGAVVLGKGDVGLGNVSNTAPADLPVSTATTAAIQAAAAQVAAQVTALSQQVSTIAGRKVVIARGRVAVPALALGVAKDVAVTWSPALSEAPTTPVVLLEPAGVALGQVAAVVKAGSVTATGCTVTLTAPLLVALGAGYVVVLAAGWA